MLTNVPEHVSVTEYCKSVSNQEKEYIFAQIYKTNTRNLFTRFDKTDSECLSYYTKNYKR